MFSSWLCATSQFFAAAVDTGRSGAIALLQSAFDCHWDSDWTVFLGLLQENAAHGFPLSEPLAYEVVFSLPPSLPNPLHLGTALTTYFLVPQASFGCFLQHFLSSTILIFSEDIHSSSFQRTNYQSLTDYFSSFQWINS